MGLTETDIRQGRLLTRYADIIDADLRGCLNCFSYSDHELDIIEENLKIIETRKKEIAERRKMLREEAKKLQK